MHVLPAMYPGITSQARRRDHLCPKKLVRCNSTGYAMRPSSLLRPVITSNTAVLVFSDDGETVNGHGPALYNYGPYATTVFKRKALFKDNVGSFVSYNCLQCTAACFIRLVGVRRMQLRLSNHPERVTFAGWPRKQISLVFQNILTLACFEAVCA